MSAEIVKPYNERRWLNGSDSPSTGSAVAYDGPAYWDVKERSIFFEVADCNAKVRLHMGKLDTPLDFAAKMQVLGEAALRFAAHLRAAERCADTDEARGD